MHDLQHFECQTQYERPCNSLALLDKAKNKREQVFLVRCLSKDSFTVSCDGQVRLFRTRGRFHSGSHFKATDHSVDDSGSSKVCCCCGKDLVQSSPTAVNCRHQSPQILKQTQKEFMSAEQWPCMEHYSFHDTSGR